MLTYANMAIDAIQAGKTSWINTFVQDEKLKTPLQNFVDTQTEYTKQIAKSTWDVLNVTTEDWSNKVFPNPKY